ncbi:MAG: glycoside hydrolase N-terminal domain-containing protein [Streptosporangiaceae bacterium]|nr:glycoside hydrolase N-terminal domain-containing protein [Streptosporangiaceae bacterium]
MTGAGIHDSVPAEGWEDAFPVGNGRHGALVFGGLREETVIVTHHHLVWSAAPGGATGLTDLSELYGPSEAYGPPDLSGRLEEVRELLLAGDSSGALARFTGDWPRRDPLSFHPAFAVRLSDASAPAEVPDGYRRSLNYRTGVAGVSWPGRQRCCFVSRARDVVVQHVTGAMPLDVTVSVDAELPGAPPGLWVSSQVDGATSGEARLVTTVTYPDGGGYVGVTRVVAGPDGLVTVRPGGGVHVTGGSELTLVTQVASDPPGGPVDARQLLVEHARLHAAAYGDVRLDLGAAAGGPGQSSAAAGGPGQSSAAAGGPGQSSAAAGGPGQSSAAAGGPGQSSTVAEDRELSVGELLARQAAQPDRPVPALLEKLFDSGRYLLLSASGLLPPRLTGLWQGDWNSAWSGAITCNANLGLQLAGAVTADVRPAVMAVADLTRDRLPDWRVNARRLFGARGFVVPAHSDGRGGLCTHFESGYPHQMWTAGADWLLVPLLDAVLAWGDAALRQRLRPVLRELAAFYEDFLTRTDNDGNVIFAPSYSPENQPRGWSPAAVNAVMDIAAARHALIAAAELAETDEAGTDEAGTDEAGTDEAETDEAGRRDARRWRELAARLPPYRIDADGALAEWAWPPAGSGLPPLPGNDEHRHVSHLYPVWPLHEITVARTPELAAAALRALRMRGAQDDSAHGYLHRALAACRLRDAELAGKLVAALIGQRFFFRSLMSSHYPKRSVYNADAACAMPGVLIDMLVDSWPPDRIELLPAVPDFLPAGRLRGVRTLTGVLVADLRWDTEAGMAEAVLVSPVGRRISVRADREPWREVVLPPAQPVRITVGAVD